MSKSKISEKPESFKRFKKLTKDLLSVSRKELQDEMGKFKEKTKRKKS